MIITVSRSYILHTGCSTSTHYNNSRFQLVLKHHYNMARNQTYPHLHNFRHKKKANCKLETIRIYSSVYKHWLLSVSALLAHTEAELPAAVLVLETVFLGKADICL